MKKIFTAINEMKAFLLLWLTQSFSALGSAMTAYALVIWSYSQEGSALVTALLMVCSYTPYVLCSIFAGALSDRWDKKKTMLVCDTLSAAMTLVTLLLLKSGSLCIWHLYVLNALNGLMNTVQQPASEVAVSALLPRKYYQKVGGIRYISNSMNTILVPILTTAVMGLLGLDAVIFFDLITFAAAFVCLLLFIRLPAEEKPEDKKESVLHSAREGLRYLRDNRGVFHLILFLASVNLVASLYNAAFPAMMLSREGAGETAMGTVNAVIGIGTLAGSLLASLLKAPKNRVKVICGTMFFSLTTENLLLAFGRTLPVWCLGGFLGWILVPVMSTNLDAILRLNVPKEIQGRVYSARNTFQFFTIPLGYFLGGFAVDSIYEPLMSVQSPDSLLTKCFGSGKGSGAAMFLATLALLGAVFSLTARHDRHIRALEQRLQDGLK
ncbi:MAG: MFS transporter [Ruminococcaceae bacterium]|nr:MFS transporter [Oscillospiraceae bacterium]